MNSTSWHFNYHDGTSIINEMLALLDENSHIEIYTRVDTFYIFHGNIVSVGEGAMMIASDDDTVIFINTNEIVYIKLKRKQNLNTTDNINND